MTTPQKPWCIYVRVSTDDQAEEGASIPAQVQSCTAYAQARGWSVPEDHVLIDDGYTGRNDKRPGFKKVLALLQEKQVRGVIAWKLKRLARSTRIVSDLLDLLRETGCEMATVAESWDTTTPMGRAMVGIGAIFAQLESEDNGVQTSAAMQHLRKLGYWIGGPIPAGMVVVPDGHRKRLVPGPDADLVRPAWGWVIGGASLAEVARRLLAAGVARPGRKGDWTPDQARTLLLSTQVVGHLVTAEEQEAVRRILAGRRDLTRFTSPGEKADQPSPLAGVLRCPTCDAAMVQVSATGNGGRYRYFRCCNKVKRRCPQKDMRAEPIEAAALRVIAEATRRGGPYADLIREELASARSGLADHKAERARLTLERDQLHARQQDIVLHVPVGSPGWSDALKIVSDKVADIDRQLANLAGIIAAGEADGRSLDEVMEVIADRAERLAHSTPEEQAIIVQGICTRITVAAETVTVSLYAPERANRAVRTEAQEWRPRAGAVRTITLTLPRLVATSGNRV